jgi:hypothetical protein
LVAASAHHRSDHNQHDAAAVGRVSPDDTTISDCPAFFWKRWLFMSRQARRLPMKLGELGRVLG